MLQLAQTGREHRLISDQTDPAKLCSIPLSTFSGNGCLCRTCLHKHSRRIFEAFKLVSVTAQGRAAGAGTLPGQTAGALSTR